MIADRNINSNKLSVFIDKAGDFIDVQLVNQGITRLEYADKLQKKATVAYMEENGLIVSAVIGYTHDTPDNSSYITQVYTLPEYRRRGLAIELLQEYFAFCKEHGLSKVWLTTRKENAFAQRTYEKAGFRKDLTFHSEHLVKYIIFLS